ncbi:TlpA disulfide reductase family protein [Paraflavisolibacter sp. H34]|uniref:TlpA disulfide reductase family protein n=1 Tax=Huijunlia imazamoxiresistens TaxID=3127457 RepID=UPI003017BE27
MRKLLFAFLLFPTFVFAQSQGFTLTGSITGLPEGTEVKVTNANDNAVLEKSKVAGGKFVVKGSIPEPGLYFLVLGKEQPQYIYLENSTISVSGSTKALPSLQVTGSKSHQDFDEFRKVFNPLVGKMNAVAGQINESPDEVQRASLMGQYGTIRQQVKEEVAKFVTAKKESYVSPFLLYVTAQLLDDPLQVEQFYLSLSESVRNTAIGKNLAEFIAYNKVGAVGTDALDFTQNDPAGQPVSLASFRGKYVLVDFWASWCKPCRMENPNVVKTFQKFNAKNFTVLGVSLDRDKEPWLKAIKDDSLAWTQVSDLQFWNNSAAQLYHVQGIPQNFLVDPKGKIIARNLRGEELEAKLCEVLGCN